MQACADKLKHEIAQAGTLDQFTALVEEYARTGKVPGEDLDAPKAEVSVPGAWLAMASGSQRHPQYTAGVKALDHLGDWWYARAGRAPC